MFLLSEEKKREESKSGEALEVEPRRGRAENSPSGAILDGLDSSSHHENGPLDGLDEEIGLGSGNVVGSGEGSERTRKVSVSFFVHSKRIRIEECRTNP